MVLQKGEFYCFMKKNKIMMRICIGILAATLISSVMVSSLFARYISSGESEGNVAYPYAFGVELTGLEMDKISVNFSRDGAHATPLGYFTETFSIPFTVKAAPYNEIATDISIKLTFNKAFSDLIKKDPYAQGASCAYRVVDTDGNVLGGTQTEVSNCIIWTSNATTLGVAQELDFVLEISVHNTSLSVGYTTSEEYKYISDAITVDVSAKQSR